MEMRKIEEVKTHAATPVAMLTISAMGTKDARVPAGTNFRGLDESYYVLAPAKIENGSARVEARALRGFGLWFRKWFVWPIVNRFSRLGS